jgi:hypothetical protein
MNAKKAKSKVISTVGISQISYVPSDIHIYRSKTGRKCKEKKEKTKGRSEIQNSNFFSKIMRLWYGSRSPKDAGYGIRILSRYGYYVPGTRTYII